MAEITRLLTTDEDFEQRLEALLAWEAVSDVEVRERVDAIIRAVREDGDAALLDYTHRLDRWQPRTAADLEISAARIGQARDRIPAEQRAALEFAAKRIRDYAEHQELKAAYPSSVLMNAIPASGSTTSRNVRA